MGERFPDVDWWCDRCGAYLNSQDGFDDHHYIWKCTECGHKNSISASNIYESHEDYWNSKKQGDAQAETLLLNRSVNVAQGCSGAV